MGDCRGFILLNSIPRWHPPRLLDERVDGDRLGDKCGFLPSTCAHCPWLCPSMHPIHVRCRCRCRCRVRPFSSLFSGRGFFPGHLRPSGPLLIIMSALGTPVDGVNPLLSFFPAHRLLDGEKGKIGRSAYLPKSGIFSSRVQGTNQPKFKWNRDHLNFSICACMSAATVV
jgi:hypothetical protein